MITENITYVDYDGETVTEEMNFHLTDFEVTEIAMELPDELTDNIKSDATPVELIEAITTVLGKKGLLDFVKRMVIKAYGKKEQGLNGKFKFTKSDKITSDFANSMACHSFIMELITDNDKSNKFFTKIVPEKVAAQMPTMPGA